ncbi:MAG: hypothetical protein ACYCSN_13935 [Acidobacteriaceae bacterium]
MSKKTETEAAASKARADKLFLETQSRNKALFDRRVATKTQAFSAPAPRRPRPRPQAAAESAPAPLSPCPAMRAGQGDSVMSFSESEELAFILNGGTFMAAVVALLLAAGHALQQQASAEAEDEGESE